MSTYRDGHAAHHSLTALKLILALVLVCLFGAAGLAHADQPSDANPPAQDQPADTSGVVPADDPDPAPDGVVPLLGDPAPASDDVPDEPTTGDISIKFINEDEPDYSDMEIAIFYLYDQDGNPVKESFLVDNAQNQLLPDEPVYVTNGSAIALFCNRDEAIVRDVPAGYTYRITRQPEGSANPQFPDRKGIDLVGTRNAEGTVQAGETAMVELHVKKTSAMLSFSSVVNESTGEPVPEDEFTYRINFTGPDGQPLTEKIYYISKHGETSLIDPTEMVITMGRNSCSFWGMPLGATYTIEEIDPSDEWTHNHDNPMSGTLNGDVDVYARHTRTEKGVGIAIIKGVTAGSAHGTMFDFKVTITLDGVELTDEFNYSYLTYDPESTEWSISGTGYTRHEGKMRSGDVLSTAGSSSRTIMSGLRNGALLIYRLPVGAVVTVEEIVPEGWEFCNPQYGLRDSIVSVLGPLEDRFSFYLGRFINDQTSVQRGDLVLKKVYDAPSGVQRPTVTYDVYVWDEDGNRTNDAFRLETTNASTGSTTSKTIEPHTNYYYRIDVRDGYEYKLVGIPEGWTYEIVEPGTIEVPGGYYEQTSATNTTGTIQADTTTEAYFTNSYREGDAPEEREYSRVWHYLYSDIDSWNQEVEPGTVSFRVRVFDEEGNESDEEFSYNITTFNSSKDHIPFHSGDIITPAYSPLNNSDYPTLYEILYRLPVGYSYEIDYVGTTDPRLSIALGAHHAGTVPSPSEGERYHNTAFASNKLIVMKDDDGGPYNGLFKFTVTLTDAEGRPLSGTYQLDYSSYGLYRPVDITLDEKGQYTFEMRGQDSVRFAWLPYGTRFKVVENDVPAEYEHTAFNAEGELTDEAGKVQTALMRNVWRAKVPVNLTFYKSCNKELTGGEFTFQLLDGDGNVVAEATNDAEGRIDFSFELDHTNLRTKLHYTVREVAGDDPAYTYDSGEKHVELYVHWNEENPYELQVDIEYLDEDLTFTNIWTEPEPEPEPTPDPEPAPKPAPKPAAATPATGDPTPAFGLVAAAGSLLAAAGVALRRKR